jgi:hypothetical protein
MFSLNKQAILGSVSSKISMTGSSLSSSPSSAGFGAGGTVIQSDLSYSLLEGFVNLKDKNTLYKMYREIYMMDSVSGPAIDQLSSLPWSSYSLIGIKDQPVQKLYEDCLSELNLVRLMTYLSTCYLVLGVSIGSLVFDKTRGIFSDCIVYNPDTCDITPIPMIGYDPKVDLKVSPEMKAFLSSKDERDKEAMKEISPDLMDKLKKGTIPLDQLTTIVLNRSNLPGIQTFSYLTRVLPIWIMEKALTRGTLLASMRRQRGILHVTIGSDTWEPTDDQYQAVASMFSNADRDPQGAIVVTRPDVSTNEVRSGSDFWSVSNERDGFTQIKLRALGLSESWGADTNYANQDNSMTMFMENLKNFRDTLTRAVLYDKVFLLLAKYHKFRRRTQAELNHNVRYDTKSNHAARDERTVKRAIITGSRNLAEAAIYQIPELKWSKELESRGDSNALNLATQAKELGLNLPLGIIAQYAGVNMNVLLDSINQDLEYRKKIKEWNDNIAKISPPPKEDDGGGGGMYGSVKKADIGKLQTNVQRAKDIATITNTNLLKDYIQRNMPPNVKVTPNDVRQILKFANNIKPNIIKM